MMRFATAFLLLLGAAQVNASTYLNIGDPAPSVSHVAWLKGEPVKGFKKGMVYVVEFWATWCGPCKANIPKLTALAKKYEGTVSIIGIDVWESTDRRDLTFGKRVSAFVNGEGDTMDYHVAADDPSEDTANAWMKAAGEGSIPTSFVIGKDGMIAWIGHAEGLERVLDEVTANKFDVQAARAQRAIQVEDIRPVKEAMDAKQFQKALSLMDSIEAKRPEMAHYHAYDRYVAYAHTDFAKTKAMTEKLLADSQGEIGVYQMVGSVYASQPDLTEQDYRYGMSLIQEALAKNDRQYLFLSMASAVSNSLHERAEAIDYAKRSIEAAQKDSHAPAPFIEFLKRNLETLEATKAG
jgi:thiol-disulfide isomerase/thioredoxin